MRISVMADGEVQLAGGLFNHEARSRMVTQAAIAELVLRVARVGQANISEDDHALIARIAEYVEQRERKFISDMESVTSSVAEAAAMHDLTHNDARAQMLAHANAPEMLSFLARTRVISTQRALRVSLSEPALLELTERVRAGYPVALAFLRHLVLDALRGDINWERSDRANSVWDLSIAFHASRAATINGIPVLLVSDDNRLHDAAASVGHSSFIARLGEYQNLLTPDGVKARERLMLEVAA